MGGSNDKYLDDKREYVNKIHKNKKMNVDITPIKYQDLNN
jgi:hypothetical protein